MVHAVGLEEDHRAEEGAVREKVSGPDELVVVHGHPVGAVVVKRRKACLLLHRVRNFVGEFQLFVVNAIEDSQDHFKAGVVFLHFPAGVAAVDKEVQVVRRSKRGAPRRPGGSVEVEAKREVGLNAGVENITPRSDFAGDGEHRFCGAGDESARGHFVPAEEVLPRFLLQGFDPLARDGFVGFPGQKDIGAEQGKITMENARDLESHFPLTDFDSVFAYFEMSIIPGDPLSSDMPRVNRDVDSRKRSR